MAMTTGLLGDPERVDPWAFLRDPRYQGRVYGGEGIRADLMNSGNGVSGRPWTDAQQLNYLNYGALPGIGDFRYTTGDPMNSYTRGVINPQGNLDSSIDPEALAAYLDQQGYKIGTAEAQGETWRWVEDAQGNYVLEPFNSYTDDRAGFLAGALGLGGVLGSSLLAGGAVGGAPAVAGADAMFTPVAGSGFGSLAPIGLETLPAIPAIPTVPSVFPIGGASLLTPVAGSGFEPLPPVASEALPVVPAVPSIGPSLLTPVPGSGHAPLPPVAGADPMPSMPDIPGLGGITDFLKDRDLWKWLLPLIGAGASQIGGDDDGGGGYVDSGYRPTITRGGWQASVQPTPVSLLTPEVTIPRTGRFGLLGGK